MLDSSIRVTGWTAAGRGLFRSPEISLPALLGGLGNLSEDGRLLPLVPWKKTAEKTLAEARIGSFSYDHAKRILYLRHDVDPDADGKVYRASTLLYGVRAHDQTDIAVHNLDIRRFSLHAVEFSNCTRCVAKNLSISDGGGALVIPPNLYAGNGIQWSGNSSHGLAEGITVRNVLDSGISPQTFAAGSRLHDVEIRNSAIDRVGLAGVEVALLNFGTGSSISNILISDVTVTHSGRGWGGNRYGVTAAGVGIANNSPGAGSLSGVTVRRTVVSNSVGSGIDISGDAGTVSLRRLRLTGNGKGVFARAFEGQGSTLHVALTASIIDANRGEAGFGGVGLPELVLFDVQSQTQRDIHRDAAVGVSWWWHLEYLPIDQFLAHAVVRHPQQFFGGGQLHAVG